MESGLTTHQLSEELDQKRESRHIGWVVNEGGLRRPHSVKLIQRLPHGVHIHGSIDGGLSSRRVSEQPADD